MVSSLTMHQRTFYPPPPSLLYDETNTKKDERRPIFFFPVFCSSISWCWDKSRGKWLAELRQSTTNLSILSFLYYTHDQHYGYFTKDDDVSCISKIKKKGSLYGTIIEIENEMWIIWFIIHTALFNDRNPIADQIESRHAVIENRSYYLLES